MPSYLTTLWGSIRTAIVTAWPEVAANGVYHAVELASIPFERKASSELPLAVFQYDPQPTGEWGADNAAESGLLQVTYLADDGTDMDALATKLETLRTELYDNGITGAQVLGYPAIRLTITDPVFLYFLNFNRPFLAGSVVAQVLVGEVP